MHRRLFLQTAAASVTAIMGPRSLALPPEHPYMKTIGLQLWTVRNQLASDLVGTMKAVAAAGYQQVELMDVMGSEEIVKVATDCGLAISSAFIDWQVIGNPTADGVRTVDAIVARASELKLRHLVFGYIGKGHRETADHYRAHADRANTAGTACRAAGIQLNYHNHSFEFKELPGGKSGFDVFVERFDKELVKFELDVFWRQIGGHDPVALMKGLKGRIAQLHLKDLLKGTPEIHDESQVPAEVFKELGNGVIDMAAVIRAGLEAGVDQCHVEQDQSPNPLESIAQSVQHLRSIERR